MASVNIKHGIYHPTHPEIIENETFELVKDLQNTTKGDFGGFLTVKDMDRFGGNGLARIYIYGLKDFMIFGEVRQQNGHDYSNDAAFQPEVPVESDEEIMTRINERFNVLDKLTLAAAKGTIRSLIVSGAPGVGKSFGINKMLEEYAESKRDTLKSSEERFVFVSGVMRPVALYMKFFEYSKNSVIVLDDVDSAFGDVDSINLLKSALDSSPKRTIHWGSQNPTLRALDIPDSFEFTSSVIFVTNINIKNVRAGDSKKVHLDALLSRSHYIDLTVHTPREKMLRIESVVLQNGMLDRYHLSGECKLDIMEFIRKNADKFSEALSLRTVVKIADLAVAFPNAEWKAIAKISLM
jgi:hypothetical protein